MKFRVLGLSLFLIVVAGGLLTHFRQQSMIPSEQALKAPPSDIPQPAKQGPFPKAVVPDSLTYDFGTMEIGDKGEHTFTIRNEGQASLEMVARPEDHSCQCTLGTLAQNGLPPGKETTITLTWEIKVPTTQFQHYAKVRTNDPETPSLTFRVQGLIGRRIVVNPGAEVIVGTLAEGKPTVRKLTIHSEVLDSFEVTMLDLSLPKLMAVKSRPLTEEEVQRLNKPDPAQAAIAEEQRKQMTTSALATASIPGGDKSAAHQGHDHEKEPGTEESTLAGKTVEAKCGYEIEVSFLPGFPIGKFRESLVIHTNVAEVPETRVSFVGTRSGPIQILPTVGTTWSAEESLLNLGRFPASAGKKVRLMVFIKKSEQDFKIEEATIDPPVLKFELIKDTKFQAPGREKFDLILEVPAGGSPISLGAMNRGLVKFVTNHPEAKEIKIEIEMASTKE